MKNLHLFLNNLYYEDLRCFVLQSISCIAMQSSIPSPEKDDK